MPVLYWVRTELFPQFLNISSVCVYYNHFTARTIWLGSQGEWEGGGPAAPSLVAARFIQKQVEFMAEIAAH